MAVFQRGGSGPEVRSLMCPRVGTDRADLRQSPTVEKTPPSRQEPPPTTTSVCFRHGGKQWGGSGLALDRFSPSRKHVGNSPRSHNAVRWCRSTSSLTGGRSPHLWKRVSSEWSQVLRTGFFDESDLSQVRLCQSRRFPAWRQRTGSAVLDVSEGGNRPGGPQAVTPSRKRLRHTGNQLRQLLPVYCRHTGKHPGRSESTLQNTSMKFFCGATLHRWAAAPPICPSAIMAVTARPKIAKSENAVPPKSVCPFAVTPARGQLTLNSLERVYTGPGLESRCRLSPWFADRDRRPWLELSARFGNHRPCSINSRYFSWPTSGRLMSSISGPLTYLTGVSNRIWRHCWGISGFPGGYGEWCPVSPC